MTQIGTFTRTSDGFSGSIQTLTLKRDVIIIVPAIATETDNAPNYRVMAGDVEIGAGWKRRGSAAGDPPEPTGSRPARGAGRVLERADATCANDYILLLFRPVCYLYGHAIGNREPGASDNG